MLLPLADLTEKSNQFCYSVLILWNQHVAEKITASLQVYHESLVNAGTQSDTNHILERDRDLLALVALGRV